MFAVVAKLSECSLYGTDRIKKVVKHGIGWVGLNSVRDTQCLTQLGGSVLSTIVRLDSLPFPVAA